MNPHVAAGGAVSPELAGWHGFGLAVQAYQKRGAAVIDWLTSVAAESRRRLNVRLVKGAYWDSEIKRAQERGFDSYPVYTRKCNTDVSYLACARRMLRDGTHLLPQFATHNAHTLAWIQCHAGKREYEFQRLHGMGAELYADVVDDVPCRVYAPVGAHEDLLPYLVRRLLENGANTSFVNQVIRHGDDPEEPEERRRRVRARPLPLAQDVRERSLDEHQVVVREELRPVRRRQDAQRRQDDQDARNPAQPAGADDLDDPQEHDQDRTEYDGAVEVRPHDEERQHEQRSPAHASTRRVGQEPERAGE